MALKIDLINSMYSMLRINGLTVEAMPEDVEVALHRLEDMMEEMYGDTLNVGYIFEEEPKPNSESGVERKHHNMISSNLGMRLVLDFGKDIPQRLSTVASSSYTTSSKIVAIDRLKGVAYPSRMPRGAGNRRFNRWRRFYPNTPVPKTSGDNVQVTLGDIDDYVTDFATYLSENGGEINNYTIGLTAGIKLVSSQISTSKKAIEYRLQTEVTPNRVPTFEMVTITIITTSGRVKTETRVFNVEPTADIQIPAIIP